MGGAVRFWPAGLLAVKMLTLEVGIRRDRDEIPIGVRVVIDLFRFGRGHVRMPCQRRARPIGQFRP